MSRPYFFSRGLITASFRSNGTDPLLNDSLVMLVMAGIRTDACCLMNDVGMGSRLQVAHDDIADLSLVDWSECQKQR